ncbi:hypothetical protein glysoja_016920 [Glycine soja]|nr:hypothetical protein glysoja_016920 [Glycine soja]
MSCCIASGGRLREKTRTTTSAQVLLRAALPCLSSSSHLIFAATATGGMNTRPFFYVLLWLCHGWISSGHACYMQFWMLS